MIKWNKELQIGICYDHVHSGCVEIKSLIWCTWFCENSLVWQYINELFFLPVGYMGGIRYFFMDITW